VFFEAGRRFVASWRRYTPTLLRTSVRSRLGGSRRKTPPLGKLPCGRAGPQGTTSPGSSPHRETPTQEAPELAAQRTCTSPEAKTSPRAFHTSPPRTRDVRRHGRPARERSASYPATPRRDIGPRLFFVSECA
jgi:hypothetical protein